MAITINYPLIIEILKKAVTQVHNRQHLNRSIVGIKKWLEFSIAVDMS